MDQQREAPYSTLPEPPCTGVRRFWREVRDQFETHEFVEQYDDVDGSYFGIGVVVVPHSAQ